MHATLTRAVFLASTIAAAIANAQQPEPSTVAGQGTGTIARPAEFLRVQIELAAKDQDPRAAVTRLKTIKESASAKLAELGAVKDSIKFTEPTMTTVGGGSEAELRRVMMARMRGKAETKPAGAPVTLTVQVTADFPLKTQPPEDLLLASFELQNRIKDADLAGLKAAAKDAAKSEEEEEEGGEESRFEPPQRKPGEPAFSYVIKLTPEELKKAAGEAFRKARASAERYAAAAGMSTGSIRQLGGEHMPSGSGRQDYYQFARYMGMDPSEIVQESEGEAAGMQPAKIEYKLVVHASFELQPPQ